MKAIVNVSKACSKPPVNDLGRRPSLNTWIVICALVVLMVVIALMESHLHNLTVHSLLFR